ncbi:MAG: nitroreductase family protein [Chthoniobacterales bacterium]
MNFLKLAQTRYATKRYNPEKDIPEEKINELKEVLRLTPSSINCQPWRFTFVRDKALKERLSEVSMHNTHKIQQAPLLIVFSVIDDIVAFEKWANSEWEERMIGMYNAARPSMSDEEIKVWFSRQLYISLGYCMAACVAMELDSTPMEGIEQDKYAEILDSAPYRPLFAVSVGYRVDDDENDPKRNPKTRRKLADVVEAK